MGILTRIIKTGLKTFGVNINFGGGGGKIDTENISTIQTCTRILVENVSRLPVLIRDGKGTVVKKHPVSKLLNRSFNRYLTSDKGRKVIERDRVLNGNGFARIIYNDRGVLESLQPIAYEAVEGIVLRDNMLYYAINHQRNPFSDRKDAEVISGDEILHFTSSNIKEHVGISPVKSLIFEAGIRQRASETLINFYKNNAMSPVVLSSTIQDLSQVKALQEFTEKFQLDNAGSSNAGKVVKLPPGFRLDTLNYKLVDAELINTLKFTNQEIISAFGIPSFLMSYETTQSIENQTLEFKTFTLNSILASYKAELENKLLSTDELEDGFYIDFDYSVLLDADLKTKASAYKEMVANGLITHNEALLKLGHQPVANENGDKHYMQSQYVSLEQGLNNTVENDGK